MLGNSRISSPFLFSFTLQYRRISLANHSGRLYLNRNLQYLTSLRCNDSNKDLLIWSSISSLTTTLLLKCSVLMSSLSTFYGIDFNRLRPLDWKKKGSRVEPVDHSPPSHSTQTKHHLVSPSTGFISILLIISIALTLLIFLKIWGPVFFPQTLYFSMNFLVMPAISLIWVLKDESLRRFAFSIVSPC